MKSGANLPAFPATEAHGLNGGWSGISMRDYFAAHAPIDMAEARAFWYRQNGNGSKQPAIEDLFDVLAMLRGRYADSMMAERAQ